MLCQIDGNSRLADTGGTADNDYFGLFSRRVHNQKIAKNLIGTGYTARGQKSIPSVSKFIDKRVLNLYSPIFSNHWPACSN
jgi:hypothetical protein